MHRVAPLVSRLVMYAFRVASEDRRLLSVVYNYPPLDGDQYYIPPRKDDYGDMNCDCNTVMYKYKSRLPEKDPVLIYLSV